LWPRRKCKTPTPGRELTRDGPQQNSGEGKEGKRRLRSVSDIFVQQFHEPLVACPPRIRRAIPLRSTNSAERAAGGGIWSPVRGSCWPAFEKKCAERCNSKCLNRARKGCPCNQMSFKDYKDDSRIRTTSESLWPRSMQRVRPSGDHRKLKICSESNCVILRPEEPSKGCTQRLSTPLSRIG